MRRMHAIYPDMKRKGIAAMQERNRWLWANDPQWRAERWNVRSPAFARHTTRARVWTLFDRVQWDVVRELARSGKCVSG